MERDAPGLYRQEQDGARRLTATVSQALSPSSLSISSALSLFSLYFLCSRSVLPSVLSVLCSPFRGTFLLPWLLFLMLMASDALVCEMPAQRQPRSLLLLLSGVREEKDEEDEEEDGM